MRAWGPSLVLTLLVAAPSVARAQVAVDYEVGGTVSIGVTDNVAFTATPEPDAPEGTPGPETDVFGTVSPFARVQFETADVTQTLVYGFGYTFNLLNSEANNYFNSLGYGLRSQVSERTQLTLALSGSQSTLAMFQLQAPAGAGQVPATTGADNILVTVGAGQGISTELTETVSFQETAAFTYAHTVVDEAADLKTQVGSLSLGGTKTFLRDRLTFDETNDLQHAVAPGAGMGAEGTDLLQVLHRARLVWSHDFDPRTTSQLGVGVVIGYDPLGDLSPIPHPTGQASLAWQHERGTLTFALNHDALPNVLLGSIQLTSGATISSLFELPKGFDLSGTGGATVFQQFLGNEGFDFPNGAFIADVAVGWVPATVPMRVSLRYQFNHQRAFFISETMLPEITRHAAILATTFTWPGAPQAGGTGFVAIPPPSANGDILARQAPASERAEAEREKSDEERANGRTPAPEGE